jgi:hypothetical protein
MRRTISERSIIVASQDQVSCDLAGDAAILDIKSGMYYGLNAVGARVWNLIQEPKPVYEVRDALLKEYEVEPECCERDLLVLLQELAAKGLIEVKDDAVA